MTAKDIVLEQVEDSSILRASLRKRDGSWQEASIELDAFITNKDGELCLEIDVFLPSVGESVTEELQTLVNKCETSAKDLQNSIRNSITEGASTAFSSISIAFQGIEDTEYALRDGRVDVTETIQHQAVYINTLFAKSMKHWTQVEDAVATGSQKVKEFQNTQLHNATLEIEQTEQKISSEMKEAQRRRTRTEEHIESLQRQIDLHQQAEATAREEADAANGRTIGFSIVSVASNEREEWGRRRDEFQEKINQAKGAQETQKALLKRLEEEFETAKKSKSKCLILREQTEKLTANLKHFEVGIHELKRSMTIFSQNLRAAETNAVTAFQYSQTLEEGRTILNDALRLKSELSAAEKLGHLLEV
ncbi:hypothetical protein SLS56_000599 [Neofusicoccum ribis]|uniref:Cyanovirin-N domain-containing protein n=1 Tax=Neofusicoccum ribis TaxID=45134 RepID=A0ABR3TD06_9PEZI